VGIRFYFLVRESPLHPKASIAYLEHSFPTVVAYAISFFLPLILSAKLGFSVGVSQLLSTPPYFFAAVLMYAEGWLGDKYRIRGPIIVYNVFQTIVGLCLLGWNAVSGVHYFGVFLVTSGCNANVPAVLAWQANNIRGQWKRAFCSASLISFGGISLSEIPEAEKCFSVMTI
jgi:hypothetical protein